MTDISPTTRPADPTGAGSPFAPAGSPTDRLLTAALVVAPILYLAADTVYAVAGWDDPAAAVLHVLGAIAYGLLVVRVATWVPGGSLLGAGLLLTAVAGAVGNAAYGFDAIHQSLGDVPLVDQTGAAVLIKPLGLLFPLSLALVALAFARLGHRWPAIVVLAAAVLWPVAHIANVGGLAVVVNVALVVSMLSSLGWTRSATHMP
ncbi:hypothetical protein [Dermatobacter hominis]|uniref:hypothetical protein n=1 Tax=Dermatobacter hominis TaxID=2884263 RepID=UPI001D11287E|nr:hypothetical protein [Dermatobacter hominis]UDY36040.1 hypothetical protein LH044_00535 [Dermatobacter hominis]